MYPDKKRSRKNGRERRDDRGAGQENRLERINEEGEGYFEEFFRRDRAGRVDFRDPCERVHRREVEERCGGEMGVRVEQGVEGDRRNEG